MYWIGSIQLRHLSTTLFQRGCLGLPNSRKQRWSSCEYGVVSTSWNKCWIFHQKWVQHIFCGYGEFFIFFCIANFGLQDRIEVFVTKRFLGNTRGLERVRKLLFTWKSFQNHLDPGGLLWNAFFLGILTGLGAGFSVDHFGGGLKLLLIAHLSWIVKLDVRPLVIC